jgi:poly(3-hydroxybutyrate) depolymerase
MTTCTLRPTSAGLVEPGYAPERFYVADAERQLVADPARRQAVRFDSDGLRLAGQLFRPPQAGRGEVAAVVFHLQRGGPHCGRGTHPDADRARHHRPVPLARARPASLQRSRWQQQITWIETHNHIELYDLDPYVSEAAAHIIQWLDTRL